MNLFAYGTLMVPEVLRAVTGREFTWREAVLRGYVRLTVRGQSYPGVFAFPAIEPTHRGSANPTDRLAGRVAAMGILTRFGPYERGVLPGLKRVRR